MGKSMSVGRIIRKGYETVNKAAKEHPIPTGVATGVATNAVSGKKSDNNQNNK